MNCLKDYIGLRDCSDIIPDSGLYINTLPGISIEALDKIANTDQVTYKNLWSDVQDEAWQTFTLDFFNQLMQCYAVKPYCDYEGIICANKAILTSAWRYLLGAQIMLFRLYTSRINWFTTVTEDEAKESLALYQAQYEAALNKAVKLVDASSCCLDEGGSPRHVTWLP